MDENNALTQLIKKVQDGTSTPEEDLTLLQNLNDTAKLLLMVIKEVKIDQIKGAINNSQNQNNN